MNKIVKTLTLVEDGTPDATEIKGPVFQPEVGLWGVTVESGDCAIFFSHNEARVVGEALIAFSQEASQAEWEEQYANQPTTANFGQVQVVPLGASAAYAA